MAEGEWMTPREVADRYAVSIRTVQGWVRRGRVKGFRTPGGQWRILRADLERLANESQGDSQDD